MKEIKNTIMNKLKSIILIFALLGIIFSSCEDDVATLQAPVTPTDVSLIIDIASDSSGMVTFTPSGTNVLTFQLFPGDGSGPEVLAPGSSFEKTFGGVDSVSFTTTLVAYGTGGASSSILSTFDLFIKLQIDPEVLIALTGAETNGVKQWVWDQEVGGVNGHFGVGSPDTDFPGFFSADANLLNPCLYDDVLEFGVDVIGAPFFNLTTQGETFANGGQIDVLFPGEGGGDDECNMADDLLI